MFLMKRSNQSFMEKPELDEEVGTESISTGIIEKMVVGILKFGVIYVCLLAFFTYVPLGI